MPVDGAAKVKVCNNQDFDELGLHESGSIVSSYSHGEIKTDPTNVGIAFADFVHARRLRAGRGVHHQVRVVFGGRVSTAEAN